MRRLDTDIKYNGIEVPSCLIGDNKGIGYLIIRKDKETGKEFSYITDNLKDAIIIAKYWRQIYRLLNDKYDRNVYDNFVQILELPFIINDKEYLIKNLNENLLKNTDNISETTNIYDKGYLIGEAYINLENGFISDMNIYIKYGLDDVFQIFSRKRTHKYIDYREENRAIKCGIKTPLKYCKSIIRRNFEERLVKWCKKARIMYLSEEESI